MLSRIYIMLLVPAAVGLLTGVCFGQAIYQETLDKEGMTLEEALLKRAENIVGPRDAPANACMECHAAEVEAWTHTTHNTTYNAMHRTDEANAILDALELTGRDRLVRRNNDCLQCHYTSVVERGRLNANWGISCESCHGPAKEWVQTHALVGGEEGARQLLPGESKDVETPEQRRARLDRAAAKGMIHSEMIYEIAANCFSCHTVPNEELVNKGGHRAGSDFNLVAWSQGEVRHNFLMSPHTNRPATPERKRIMYVVGAMVDLEFTVRNLASSKEEGTFRTTMRERANALLTQINAINEAATIEELAGVINDVPKTFDEGTTVDSALAKKIGEAARAVARKYDGTELAAIDDLLPGEGEYKGSPHSP